MQVVDQLLKGDVNLTNCDREPIHIPGSIQPHGVLLALDDDDCIAMASTSAGKILERSADKLAGVPFKTLVDEHDFSGFTKARRMDPIKQANPIPIKIHLPLSKKVALFDGILHRSGGLLLLELEPVENSDLSFKGFYYSTQKAITRLQATTSILELCDTVAEEVRRLTGFDRVMVYRFDTDWHGEVVSEAKRDDLESFLGLHYPASDIPVQARKLYEKNWLRLIHNVDYQPSPLVPALNPRDGKPLDLSLSVLRSVSPIHCEYLRNMGVSASMSISLLRDGTSLWGLIACHHYSPRLVPYEVRLASEFLGQTLSLLVSSRERVEWSQKQAHIEQIKNDLISRASLADDFVGGLLENSRDFLQMTGADGAAILLKSRVHKVGITPSDHEIRELSAWLDTDHSEHKNYVTDHLPKEYMPAVPFAGVASGVLSIPLSGKVNRDRILWFRQELVRTVNWAGAPQKNESKVSGEVRLSPRGSFALWQETVRHTSLRWTPVEIAAAETLVHAISRVILIKTHEIAQLNEELRSAARAKDEFLAVVSHELRTPLNAILGWSELLINGDLPREEYDDALATIRRNATTQQQLIEDLLDVSRIISGKMRLNVTDVEPYAFVSAAVDAVRPAADARRISINAILDSNAGIISGDSTRLQQIVWNLLSNAVKFTPKGGKIVIGLKRLESSVEIAIRDNGEGIDKEFLPHVFERFRQAEAHVGRRHQGLGLGLAIVRHLVELHGGTITAESEGKGKGSTFRVRLPITVLSQPTSKAADTRSEETECPPQLKGLRVLVVDDEPDARKMLDRILVKCHSKVYVAADAHEGLAVLQAEKPDVVISDIGMPDVDGYDFIKMIRDLNDEKLRLVPVIALTAFARSEDRTKALMAGFTTHIAKPITQRELLAVLASVSGRNLWRRE